MKTLNVYFKSGSLLVKAFVIFFVIFILINVALFNYFVLIKKILFTAGIFINVIIFSIIGFYFLMKSTIKKMIDPNKGLKIKNQKKERYFLNIHFRREDFKKEDYIEYQKHYSKFFKVLIKDLNLNKKKKV